MVLTVFAIEKRKRGRPRKEKGTESPSQQLSLVEKIHNFFLKNPGATSRDATNATFVDARARRSEMRTKHGIVFKEVGERKYPGESKPFKRYAIQQFNTPEALQVARQAVEAFDAL